MIIILCSILFCIIYSIVMYIIMARLNKAKKVETANNVANDIINYAASKGIRANFEITSDGSIALFAYTKSNKRYYVTDLVLPSNQKRSIKISYEIMKEGLDDFIKEHSDNMLEFEIYTEE